MTRWPWITLLLGAILLFNPYGLDFFHAAFLSGEQLTRNIIGPIYLTGLACLGGLILLECGIRYRLARRKAPRETST